MHFHSHHDYIIIGSGSSGAVVCNRLIKAGYSVLLLEAGPDDSNPILHMPGGTQEILRSKKYNWQIETEPQTALNNRTLLQHRGKVLGGSSNLNGMVAIRGNSACYDHWAELGNDGWAYQDVLKNFKAIENCTAGSLDYHGEDGELPIRKTQGQNIIFDRFIAAGKELGMPLNQDFNGKTQDGVGRYDANILNGQRWGSSRAFIKPIKKHKHLTLKTQALVEKILFEHKQARGVSARIKGHALNFAAKKEIILCAGAFNSPQLLLLSGIGDAERLKELDIKPIKNLPGVGKNLQDHLSLLMNYTCSLPVTLNGVANNPFKQIAAAFNYFARKQGPAATNQIEAGGFYYSNPALSAPDIQLHIVPTLMYNLTDKPPKQHGISVRACNLTPFSRGYVDLYTHDPADHPKIDFKFLHDERDLPTLISAFRLVERLSKAQAWDGILGEESKGGSRCKTDEQISDFIREYIDTDYHPVGSCKMGNDEMAVVDKNLRVHGIEGLRVADASIMPTIVRGNTNIPCMMIGDKAAELILADI